MRPLDSSTGRPVASGRPCSGGSAGLGTESPYGVSRPDVEEVRKKYVRAAGTGLQGTTGDGRTDGSPGWYGAQPRRGRRGGQPDGRGMPRAERSHFPGLGFGEGGTRPL